MNQLILKKILKNVIKKNKIIYWSFFHPDNFLKFKFANNAEKMAWEFVINKMYSYKSICEIGCFNGRTTIILKNFLKGKSYVGYDLNIFAIFIANILKISSGSNKKFFFCKNAIFSSSQDCELFVSVATLIYIKEYKLKKFIKSLKRNETFKAILMHEIFINEEFYNGNKSIISDNLNIHSISMIKNQFGKGFSVDIKRTYYSNWEKKDRISAILAIKRI